MSRASILSCYMIMIFYFIISCNKQFITYPAFIARLKNLLSSSTDMIRFLSKCFFITFLQYPFSLRLTSNKFIDCTCSSVKNNRLAKSIINTNNFISKTARNTILIHFGMRKITIIIITFNSF